MHKSETTNPLPPNLRHCIAQTPKNEMTTPINVPHLGSYFRWFRKARDPDLTNLSGINGVLIENTTSPSCLPGMNRRK